MQNKQKSLKLKLKDICAPHAQKKLVKGLFFTLSMQYYKT